MENSIRINTSINNNLSHTLIPVREEEGVGTVVQNNEGLFCIVNSLGLIITSRAYDKIFYFYNEIGIISLNKKYGLIDKNGEELFEPIHTGFALTDNKDLILVKDELWSVIDTETKEIKLENKPKEEVFQLLNLNDDVLEELPVNWLE